MTEAEILAWVKAHKSEIVRNVIAGRTPKDNPVAIIMAGLPGSGKTEFLNHIIKTLPEAVTIDLDILVAQIPGYSPEIYYKYRKAANVLVSALLKQVNKMKINFALDGTFCHDRGAHNIEEALKHGFDVNLFLINQEPEKAWELAEARRKLTGRPISREGFVETCHKIIPKINEAINKFRDNPNFYFNAVQKTDNILKPYEYSAKMLMIDKKIENMYNDIK